jgi:hypothetical protein
MKQAVKHAKKADKTEIPLPPGLATIDERTERHAKNYNMLANTMAELEGKIADLKAEYLPALRDQVARVKMTHDALNAHILAHPDLFTKPRARTLHGFKVGYRKLEGKIVFSDEARSIDLAIEKLTADQVELLIRQTYSINKDAAAQLPDNDLKRIGGEITDPVDQVVIQSATGDVTRLVEALIKETDK